VYLVLSNSALASQKPLDLRGRGKNAERELVTAKQRCRQIMAGEPKLGGRKNGKGINIPHV